LVEFPSKINQNSFKRKISWKQFPPSESQPKNGQPKSSPNIDSVVCLSFESCNQQTSVLVCRYVFRIFRSSSYIKVIVSRSRLAFHSIHSTYTARLHCVCLLRFNNLQAEHRYAFDSWSWQI